MPARLISSGLDQKADAPCGRIRFRLELILSAWLVKAQNESKR
jgi:hypothetical protein